MNQEFTIRNREIRSRLERMKDKEAIEIEGVNVRKDADTWWIQAGGGVQFTGSLQRAVRLVRELATHIADSNQFRNKAVQEDNDS